MAGVLSKGITLSYKKDESYVVIPNLQVVPELGGSSEKVDVTTLADGNYKYINGIKDFGDLAFKFLYDNSGAESNYRICRGLEEAEEVVEWKVEFPDGTGFVFSGEASTAIDSASVNSALTFTLNITLNSDIAVTNPTA
jgi:hypothetical protein